MTEQELLDECFDKLERDGIVARQNFTCCQSCGLEDIRDEMAEMEAEGTKVRGFVFYHDQDAKDAAEGRGLHLTYGSTSDDEAEDLKIGRRVVEELQSWKFKSTWDGKISSRIHVEVAL